MNVKKLKLGFLNFYEAVLGIAIEVLVTIVLMAAAFFIGILILSWFHR